MRRAAECAARARGGERSSERSGWAGTLCSPFSSCSTGAPAEERSTSADAPVPSRPSNPQSLSRTRLSLSLRWLLLLPPTPPASARAGVAAARSTGERGACRVLAAFTSCVPRRCLPCGLGASCEGLGIPSSTRACVCACTLACVCALSRVHPVRVLSRAPRVVPCRCGTQSHVVCPLWETVCLCTSLVCVSFREEVQCSRERTDQGAELCSVR